MTDLRSLKSIFLALISIMVTGCQIPVTIPTPVIVDEAASVAQTPTPLTVVELATPLPSPTNTPLPEPTATPLPTETLVAPTPLPTETSAPVAPMARLRESDYDYVNVRSGPSTAYPVVASFSTEDEAAIIGRNEIQDWWQISMTDTLTSTWVFADLVTVTGDLTVIPVVEVAPPPEPTAAPIVEVEATEPPTEADSAENSAPSSEGLADELRCGKDFCVTFQELLSIGENGGCIGNHSIYITVLEGLPPGRPMDGVVIGDTYNNVEVASGSHGPGRTEITLWSNSMTLTAKRHIDGTPYTSQESFNFTAHDELIPPEILAAAGYCEGSVEKCRVAHQNNQVCRGHYSWRVTFHKFD